MRYGFMLFAIVATAQQQNPTGFVNERLLRQSFANSVLPSPKMNRLPLKRPIPSTVKPQTRYLAGRPQDGACAIPLLEAQVKEADPKIVGRPLEKAGDEKMIVPTMRPCP